MLEVLRENHPSELELVPNDESDSVFCPVYVPRVPLILRKDSRTFNML